MNRFFQAALAAAGFVAFMGQAGADETRLPPSLTAFGADAPIPSAASLPDAALNGPVTRFSQDVLAAPPVTLQTNFGSATEPSEFAASFAVSGHLAIDTGYDVNLAQRFGNYDGEQSPLIDQSSFAVLANGGHYLGATYMPSPDMHVRLGAADWSDRRDRLGFDTALTGLPLPFDNTRSQSLLAGLAFDVTGWASLGVSAIHNVQQGFGAFANLATGRVETQTLDMSANLKLGNGWVTTASYAQGLSQLDQRNETPLADGRSYSIAIAKHGLFGDDALGVAFSRPAPGLLDTSGFSAVSASGDLPPQFIAGPRIPGQGQETDLQLGYVTSFLDGALALQANAAYEMNYQGQNGATSVAVLSRAKIKF